MRVAATVFVLGHFAAACTLGGKNGPGEMDAGAPPNPFEEDCSLGPMDPLPETGVGRVTGYDVAGITDGDRTCAKFDDPVNVKIIADGTIILADYNNNLLRQVTPTGDVTTFTSQSGFFRPFGIALMADGTMYAETDWNTAGLQSADAGAIWRVTPTGEATLIAENTGRLRGLVPLPDGRLFATDYLNHCVGIFNPVTGAFAPLAGERGTAGSLDGTGTGARFFTPYDTVPLPNGNMVVADFDNHCLREVTLGGVVTTYAGLCGTAGNAVGPLASARFNHPQGLAIDSAGIIYVTDIDNFVVRRIENGVVSTLAGSGVAGFADGPPLEAQFNGLEGIDVAADGSMLYITDGDRGLGMPFHRLRRLPMTPAPPPPPPMM